MYALCALEMLKKRDGKLQKAVKMTATVQAVEQIKPPVLVKPKPQRKVSRGFGSEGWCI